MIKLKGKNHNLIQIEQDGEWNLCPYERYIYVNPSYIVKMYKSHSWKREKANGGDKMIKEYCIEVSNPPHNVRYKITRDCYYKLEQLLSK